MADRASIDVAAIVFAESKRACAFSAGEFTRFLGMAGETLEEERADEILGELVAAGSLREIGPGVYAQAVRSA